MERVLLTNDDGPKCIGLLALLEELGKDFNVTAVVPQTEKSWVGKAISTKPVKLRKINLGNCKAFALNGTPADCVQVGMHFVMRKKPAFAVAGINRVQTQALQGCLAAARFPLLQRQPLKDCPLLPLLFTSHLT